jgi:hypothetical protein
MPDETTADDEFFVGEGGLRARDLRDPRAMRALAHPRRFDLIELLHREGPLTATQCAERLEDSPAGCSYHLRQLARYGFVEEADGGVGRERPWQVVKTGLTIRTDPAEMTAAQRAAVDLLEDVISGRRAEWLQRWHRNRNQASAAWRSAASESDFGFWATPEEVQELNRRIFELLAPYQQRTFDEGRPAPGAEFVSYLIYAFPHLQGRRPAATETTEEHPDA